MDMKTMMAGTYDDLSGSEQVCPDSNNKAVSHIKNLNLPNSVLCYTSTI